VNGMMGIVTGCETLRLVMFLVKSGEVRKG